MDTDGSIAQKLAFTGAGRPRERDENRYESYYDPTEEMPNRSGQGVAGIEHNRQQGDRTETGFLYGNPTYGMMGPAPGPGSEVNFPRRKDPSFSSTRPLDDVLAEVAPTGRHRNSSTRLLLVLFVVSVAAGVVAGLALARILSHEHNDESSTGEQICEDPTNFVTSKIRTIGIMIRVEVPVYTTAEI